MTIVSGHQPAYLPWLGLLHKASLCDVFIYMDDVQFLDRDFNHRNRVLAPNGQVLWLTVPVDRKASSSRLLKDILIKRGDGQHSWQHKHWSTLKACYGKAPYFKVYASFFEQLYQGTCWKRLADLNLAILRQVFAWFNIHARIVIGSELGFSGKKSDLVLEHCRCFGAQTVVTGSFGRDYITLDDFNNLGVKVHFQDYNQPTYKQRIGSEFISRLSFVDLLFNHGPDATKIMRQDNIGRTEL